MNVKVQLSSMTAAQLAAEFERLKKLFDELDGQEATQQLVEKKQELAAQIESVRAAHKALESDPKIDVTPLEAAAPELVKAEQPAATTDPNKAEATATETVEDDQEAAEISDEEIQRAAQQAISGTAPKESAPSMTPLRASLKRATRGNSQSAHYGSELDSMADIRDHIARNSKKSSPNGPILGYERFDRDRAQDSGMLLYAGMSEDETADVLNRAVGGCGRCGVNRASCGCPSNCGPVINQAPPVFDNISDPMNEWITEVPMDDACIISVDVAKKRVPYEVGEWGYCHPTGQVDADGKPIMGTGKIVTAPDGTQTVPVVWDPNNPDTWKTVQTLNLETKKERYALQASNIAIDVPRSQKLCNGTAVDRELGFAAQDLRISNAARTYNAMIAYALSKGFSFNGDGSGALNFADGLTSLLADEQAALERDQRIRFKDYDVFVLNAGTEWIQNEKARALHGESDAMHILNKVFNSVIFSHVLPAGVTPAAVSSGVPGQVATLTPASCVRDIHLIVAHRQKWTRPVGQSVNLTVDRADRDTARSNSEFHFLESEQTDVPLGVAAAMHFNFKLNNKGMRSGVAEPCAAPTGP